MGRRFNVVTATLIAITLYAVMSTTAFGLESVWLVGGAKPTEQVKMGFEGKFTLEDTKGGIFGEAVKVECKEFTMASTAGFVGPGHEGLIETLLAATCVTVSGTCPEVVAKDVNFPWLTNIELIGSKFYDDIVTEASGQTVVGWQVSCGGVIEDVCTASLLRAELTNEAGGTVDMSFNPADGNQPAASCTRGGAGTGLWSGLLVMLTTEGQALAVSEG